MSSRFPRRRCGITCERVLCERSRSAATLFSHSGAWYRGFEVGDEIHWVPAVSYLNFVVTNGVVLVPAYWREGLPGREREKDEFVRETFQRLFPERRVVQINPLDVNMIGGGMHCITQQQPRVE